MLRCATICPVRTPGRRLRPKRVGVLAGVDLEAVADVVSYVGSAEHKVFPSSAGIPRADATKCDPQLHGDFAQLTSWLKTAIVAGRVSEDWSSAGFPKYVWVEEAGAYYQARLVNAEQGTYKGWEIDPSELPKELRDV